MQHITRGIDVLYNNNYVYAHARQLLKKRSGFEPIIFEMCGNSCVLYYGDFAQATACPTCKMGRWTTNQRGQRVPQKKFAYFPLIPRMLSQLRSESRRSLLLYGHQYNTETLPSDSPHQRRVEGEINDIYDGVAFRHLKEQGMFSDSPFSLFFGASTDGFTIFRKYDASYH